MFVIAAERYEDFELRTISTLVHYIHETALVRELVISVRIRALQVKQPRSQWQPYRTVRVRNSLVGCVRIFKPGIMAHIQGSIIIRFELIRCEWWCCGFL